MMLVYLKHAVELQTQHTLTPRNDVCISKACSRTTTTTHTHTLTPRNIEGKIFRSIGLLFQVCSMEISNGSTTFGCKHTEVSK